MKSLIAILLLWPSLAFSQTIDAVATATPVVIAGKMDLPVIAPAKDQKDILYTLDISSWPLNATVVVEIFGDDDKAPFCRVTFVKRLNNQATVKCPLFGDSKSITRQAKPVATVLQGGPLNTTVKGETK